MFYPDSYLKSITHSLRILAHQANKPFYFTQEFWTVIAILVALFTPLLVLWLSNKPKKSKLVVKGIKVINQDNASEELEKNMPRLLNAGRVIIENIGKYKASSVEAYVEKIFDMEDNGNERGDFIPMPLVWTHGKLNKNGPTIRDIYPHQTVYLDVFNHCYDDNYVGNNIISFAVAAGHNTDNLSRVALGQSKIFITLYQESGQVDKIRLTIDWDLKDIPKLSIS